VAFDREEPGRTTLEIKALMRIFRPRKDEIIETLYNEILYLYSSQSIITTIQSKRIINEQGK
jgi:hypothetical protein